MNLTLFGGIVGAHRGTTKDWITVEVDCTDREKSTLTIFSPCFRFPFYESEPCATFGNVDRSRQKPGGRT